LRRTGALAAELGMRAYLVGGPVRDLLLGLPAPDLDVAVEGSAHKLAEVLARRLAGRVHKATDFMTATVVFRDGTDLDIARTRRETYPEPGALPQVEPAGLDEDLTRRDFTVNAMAVALAPERFGRLIDPLGGLADLNARRVRVLHDGSFEDDPTRMLRALRFMLRLDFELEAHTRALLGRAVAERRLAVLSGARLRNELRRIFAQAPASALAELQELDLLAAMGLAPATGEACTAARLIPQAASALEIELDQAGPAAVGLGLYAGLSPADPAALGERLMLEASERSRLQEAARVAAAPPDELTRCEPDSGLHLALRGMSPAGAVACWTIAGERARRRLEHYWLDLRGVSADITGEDLKAAGYQPGPRFADALEAALAAKIDQSADRDGQLRAALELLATDGDAHSKR